MEFLFILVPPAAALLVIAPVIRRIVASWRAAATELGLDYVPGIFGTLGRIVGRISSGQVEVSLAAGETMRIEIDGGRLPYDLSIARRGLIPRNGEIETGDFHFDSRVSLVGSTTSVLAALTPVARIRLGRLAEDGRVVVRDGRLTLSFPRPRSVPDVVEVIRDAVDLFERMTWTGPIGERLLDNFELERDPSVRERLFKVLLYEAADPIRHRAIQRAVSDLNPEIRLAGVKALRSGGWEEAVALYKDRKTSSRYRAEALRHLALTFGRDRALPLVEDGLGQRSTEICSMAVETIGAWRHREASATLRTLARTREPAVVERVATALGRIGGTSAQQLLIELSCANQRGVRQAAIDALGRAGDLDAIPHLARIKDFGLRGPVREAIGAIQARCGRQAEGALSLSRENAHQGAVSVSEEAGRVSMGDPHGREK